MKQKAVKKKKSARLEFQEPKVDAKILLSLFREIESRPEKTTKTQLKTMRFSSIRTRQGKKLYSGITSL